MLRQYGEQIYLFLAIFLLLSGCNGQINSTQNSTTDISMFALHPTQSIESNSNISNTESIYVTESKTDTTPKLLIEPSLAPAVSVSTESVESSTNTQITDELIQETPDTTNIINNPQQPEALIMPGGYNLMGRRDTLSGTPTGSSISKAPTPCIVTPQVPVCTFTISSRPKIQ